MEPKAGEDAGAEDAVSGGDHLLVLAAREPAPDDGARLQLHGEVFADASAAVEVELDTEVAGEAGAADFDDEFRGAGRIPAGVAGLAAEVRRDAQEEVGLRSVLGTHHPGAVAAGVASGSVATVEEKPPTQVDVQRTVIGRYGRGHENDSIDQFGLLQVGHCFPAAEEFRGVETIAFVQGGRQCKGKIVHEGNSKFRLSRGLLGWMLFAGSLWAQTPLYLDLSGDWRMSADDRPAYAAPDFDDRAWPTLALPRGKAFFHGFPYWLRRRVDLPAGIDRSQLALTLGSRSAGEIAAAAKAWGQNDDITVVTVRRTA